MSETHFKISKKVIVTSFAAMAICIASLIVYIYQQDKSQVLDSINIQGAGILSNTQVQQHLLQEVIRLDGADATHAANQQGHHGKAKGAGG